jgi:predicted secreted Zn-dependent protease
MLYIISLIISFVVNIFSAYIPRNKVSTYNYSYQNNLTNEKKSNPKDVTFSENYDYYQIYGATVSELQEEVNTKGPEDFDGRVWAYAAWNINWNYPFKTENGRCVLYEPIEVTINVTYTLPKWDKPNNASPDLTSKWDKFYKNLVIHEKGHKDIALNIARLIFHDFQNMKSYQNCDIFLSELDKTGYGYIDKAHDEDKKYDLDTGHGITQGAIFP